MIIMRNGNDMEIVTSPMRPEEYIVRFGANGKRYVDRKSVGNVLCHVTEGNSKVGDVLGLNFPVEYTCDHRCECYRNGDCYACGGFYQYDSNQIIYAENFNFYKSCTTEQFVAALQLVIDDVRRRPRPDLMAELEKAKEALQELEPEVRDFILRAVERQIERYDLGILWRYFTIGDIPDSRFIDCMVMLAKANPDVSFWTYTKKYVLVNDWIDKNGELPDNLVIVFSHWMNKDGTYFPMPNPHNLPTSEFIPLGREDLLETVTWVCPCSDPTWIGTCSTCEHRCGTLKKGQSMALKEHSTSQTRKRDKEVKEQRKAMLEEVKNSSPVLSRLLRKAKINV